MQAMRMPSGVIAGQADRMFHPSPANSPILFGIRHVAHKSIVADIEPMIPQLIHYRRVKVKSQNSFVLAASLDVSNSV